MSGAAGLLVSDAGQFMLLVVGTSLFVTLAMARCAAWLGGRIDDGQSR